MSQEIDADELIEELLVLEGKIQGRADNEQSTRGAEYFTRQRVGVSKAREVVQELRDSEEE